jgi:hypothetical protein
VIDVWPGPDLGIANLGESTALIRLLQLMNCIAGAIVLMCSAEMTNGARASACVGNCTARLIAGGAQAPKRCCVLPIFKFCRLENALDLDQR